MSSTAWAHILPFNLMQLIKDFNIKNRLVPRLYLWEQWSGGRSADVSVETPFRWRLRNWGRLRLARNVDDATRISRLEPAHAVWIRRVRSDGLLSGADGAVELLRSTESRKVLLQLLQCGVQMLRVLRLSEVPLLHLLLG